MRCACYEDDCIKGEKCGFFALLDTTQPDRSVLVARAEHPIPHEGPLRKHPYHTVLRAIRAKDLAPLLSSDIVSEPEKYWQQFASAIQDGRFLLGRAHARGAGNPNKIEFDAGIGRRHDFSLNELIFSFSQLNKLEGRDSVDIAYFLEVGIGTAELALTSAETPLEISFWRMVFAHLHGLKIQLTVRGDTRLSDRKGCDVLGDNSRIALTEKALIKPGDFWDSVIQKLCSNSIGFGTNRSVANILIQHVGVTMTCLAEGMVPSAKSSPSYVELVSIGVERLNGLLVITQNSPQSLSSEIRSNLPYFQQLIGELIVYLRTGSSAFPGLILPHLPMCKAFQDMQRTRVFTACSTDPGAFVEQIIAECVDPVAGFDSEAMTYRAVLSEFTVLLRQANEGNRDVWKKEILVHAMDAIPNAMAQTQSVPHRNFLLNLLVLIVDRTHEDAVAYFAKTDTASFMPMVVRWESDPMIGHGSPYSLQQARGALSVKTQAQLAGNRTIAGYLRQEFIIALESVSDDYLEPMFKSAIRATRMRVQALIPNQKEGEVAGTDKSIDKAVELFAQLVDLLTTSNLIKGRKEAVQSRDAARDSWFIDKGIYRDFLQAVIDSPAMARLLGQYFSVGNPLTTQQIKLLVPVAQVVEIHRAKQLAQPLLAEDEADISAKEKQRRQATNKEIVTERKRVGKQVIGDVVGRMETAPHRLLKMGDEMSRLKEQISKLEAQVKQLKESGQTYGEQEAQLNTLIAQRTHLEALQGALIAELAAQQFTMFAALNPVAAEYALRDCDTQNGRITSEMQKEPRRIGNSVDARKTATELIRQGVPPHHAVAQAARQHGIVLHDLVPTSSQRPKSFVAVAGQSDLVVDAMAGAVNQVSKLLSTQDSGSMTALMFPQDDPGLQETFGALAGYNLDVLLGQHGFTSDQFLLSADKRLVAFGQMSLVYCAHLFSLDHSGHEGRKSQYLKRLAAIIASETTHDSHQLVFDIITRIIRDRYSLEDRIEFFDHVIALGTSGGSKSIFATGRWANVASALGYRLDPGDDHIQVGPVRDICPAIAGANLDVIDNGFVTASGQAFPNFILSDALRVELPDGSQVVLQQEATSDIRGLARAVMVLSQNPGAVVSVRPNCILTDSLNIAGWSARTGERGDTQEIVNAMKKRLKEELFIVAKRTKSVPIDPKPALELLSGWEQKAQEVLPSMTQYLMPAALAAAGLTQFITESSGVAISQLELGIKPAQLLGPIQAVMTKTEEKLLQTVQGDKNLGKLRDITTKALQTSDGGEVVKAATDIVANMYPTLSAGELTQGMSHVFHPGQPADGKDNVPPEVGKRGKRKGKANGDLQLGTTVQPALLVADLTGDRETKALVQLAREQASMAREYGRVSAGATVFQSLIQATTDAYGPPSAAMIKSWLEPSLQRANDFHNVAIKTSLAGLERAAQRARRQDDLLLFLQQRLAQQQEFQAQVEFSLSTQLAEAQLHLSAEQLRAITEIIVQHRQFALDCAVKQMVQYRRSVKQYYDILLSMHEIRVRFDTQYRSQLAEWVDAVYSPSSPLMEIMLSIEEFFTQNGKPISRADLLPDPVTVLSSSSMA